MSSVGELCFSSSRTAKTADGKGRAARPSCQTSGMLHSDVVQRGWLHSSHAIYFESFHGGSEEQPMSSRICLVLLFESAGIGAPLRTHLPGTQAIPFACASELLGCFPEDKKKVWQICCRDWWGREGRGVISSIYSVLSNLPDTS